MADPQLQLLRSLREGTEPGEGLTTWAWERASGMKATSFFKARTALVAMGYVEHIGSGRGSKYVVADMALDVLTPHSAITPR